eukprot:Tbor_TRINITY_DN6668_c0_g1::TRINITY_DN6668_c0_g1_i1::g.3086::m.3086/K08829/MAK; male germ cell-associated kinase
MNRYTILSQLGDGSFGIVSKASHQPTNEIVAVKKMKQRFNTWEECLQLREIQSLRRLQHPNIIKLKEVVRENNELFMIFEYMEQNIYQIMKGRSGHKGSMIFSDKEIRSIMAQTLFGLASIHKGGFMHRDLKPENLLTKGDIVKIADFGLAKEIRSRPPFTEYVSTRWYRAPEIILRSTHYNSPIDIWALGVIFAELYLNRPLFPGASDTDQLYKICSILGNPNPSEWDEGYQLARRMNIRFPTIAPTPLKQLLQNAPPSAIDLIEQMLRFNPGYRPTCSMCLNHPYFTGQEESSGGIDYTNAANIPVTISMYRGLSSGQPHNPFQISSQSQSSTSQTTSHNTSHNMSHTHNVAPKPGSFSYNTAQRPTNSPAPGMMYSNNVSGLSYRLYGTGVNGGSVMANGGRSSPNLTNNNDNMNEAHSGVGSNSNPFGSGMGFARNSNRTDDDSLY